MSLHITFDTTEGPQEMPPEALAQAFEDFMLARFYTDPESLDSRTKARNLRNHFYRFLTEPVRVRSEVDSAHEFMYMSKGDLIQLHGDLTLFETLLMKRGQQTGIRDKDTLAAVSEIQEVIQVIVDEKRHD